MPQYGVAVITGCSKQSIRRTAGPRASPAGDAGRDIRWKGSRPGGGLGSDAPRGRRVRGGARPVRLGGADARLLHDGPAAPRFAHAPGFTYEELAETFLAPGALFWIIDDF